ncbi:Mss4-like protein [Lophiotrema nucula]|uniref:Mss4-like protein n=1 Tax=Lophiotrema nucula TaxID=690887 RepID=A0A6A5Z4R8_9PLEO|nr:Mss4-like protein [Lophiotrema nucula]
MSENRTPTVHTLMSNAESKKYQASCHCQLIRYNVTLSPGLDDPDSWVVECNCSICSRNGYLNVYVQTECIEFETIGLESELVEKYRFGKQRVQHYFCSRCGSSIMAESIEPGFYEGVKALNVRMFKDVDLKTLQRREVDGRSL